MDNKKVLEKHNYDNALMLEQLQRRPLTPEVQAEIARLKTLVLQPVPHKSGPHHTRKEQEEAAHELAIELLPERRLMTLVTQPVASDVPA